MAKSLLILLVLFGFIAVEVYGQFSRTHNQHIGSQVLRIAPGHSRDAMNAIEKQLGKMIDFWLHPSTVRYTDIHVSSENLENVKKFLEDNKYKFSVMISDVGLLVNDQKKLTQSNTEKQNGMNWEEYQSYDTIMEYLDQVAAKYPDIATVETIGSSTEGRLLKVIKIGRNGTGKPAFFLDGGMHAREWIGPAAVTFFVNQLTEYQTENQDILNNIDIYINPIANPDGYEYSRYSPNTRLWRKTRSNHSSIIGCLGVDPNRNFEVEWGGDGTSSDKCSDIFHGPAPFSEPETAAMADFVVKKKFEEGVNWIAYFAIHSYGQMWLVPWGWTYELPPTYADLMDFGGFGVEALSAVYGTPYELGSVTEILTPGAGGSDDWAYGTNLFRYSQTVEVRDTGRFGFLLPKEQIIPTAEETWAGIKATARFVLTNP